MARRRPLVKDTYLDGAAFCHWLEVTPKLWRELPLGIWARFGVIRQVEHVNLGAQNNNDEPPARVWLSGLRVITIPVGTFFRDPATLHVVATVLQLPDRADILEQLRQNVRAASMRSVPATPVSAAWPPEPNVYSRMNE